MGVKIVMTTKWFMSPYNWVILPLTQPQVANQQKKFTLNVNSSVNLCLPFPAKISFLVIQFD